MTCSALGISMIVAMRLPFALLRGSDTLEEVSLGEEHSEEMFPYPS